jgi:hypothetical protein
VSDGGDGWLALLPMPIMTMTLQVMDRPADEEEEEGAAMDADSGRRGKCVVIKTSTRQVRTLLRITRLLCCGLVLIYLLSLLITSTPTAFPFISLRVSLSLCVSRPSTFPLLAWSMKKNFVQEIWLV